MIATQTIVIQCYCSQCGAGLLQPLLQDGFMSELPLSEMIDKTITCAKCNHGEKLEDVITLLPEMFNIWSSKDLSKMKTDDSMKKFLESDQ